MVFTQSMTRDSVWYVIMSTQIVRYENEYNDYMKKMMMMITTTSELGTAIISSTDFVDCGEMCVMWFFLQRRFLYLYSHVKI